MAFMKDTEGEKIPNEPDIDGREPRQYFDLWFAPDCEDENPLILLMNVPNFFEVPGTGEVYDSAGAVEISLSEVLEEYKDSFHYVDGGNAIPQITSYLRRFCDELESEHKEFLQVEAEEKAKAGQNG